MPDFVDHCLLIPPLRHQAGGLLLQIRLLLFDLFQAGFGGLVGFFLQRLFLHLKLHDLTLQHVDFGGHGIEFDLQAGGSLVDQIHRLVRAGNDQRCICRKAPRRRRWLHLGCGRRGGLRSVLSDRAGSRRYPRRTARRPSPAGSDAPGRRPSRCISGIHRASSRRWCGARRAQAVA